MSESEEEVRKKEEKDDHDSDQPPDLVEEVEDDHDSDQPPGLVEEVEDDQQARALAEPGAVDKVNTYIPEESYSSGIIDVDELLAKQEGQPLSEDQRQKILELWPKFAITGFGFSEDMVDKYKTLLGGIFWSGVVWQYLPEFLLDCEQYDQDEFNNELKILAAQYLILNIISEINNDIKKIMNNNGSLIEKKFPDILGFTEGQLLSDEKIEELMGVIREPSLVEEFMEKINEILLRIQSVQGMLKSYQETKNISEEKKKELTQATQATINITDAIRKARMKLEEAILNNDKETAQRIIAEIHSPEQEMLAVLGEGTDLLENEEGDMRGGGVGSNLFSLVFALFSLTTGNSEYLTAASTRFPTGVKPSSSSPATQPTNGMVPFDPSQISYSPSVDVVVRNTVGVMQKALGKIPETFKPRQLPEFLTEEDKILVGEYSQMEVDDDGSKKDVFADPGKNNFYIKIQDGQFELVTDEKLKEKYKGIFEDETNADNLYTPAGEDVMALMVSKNDNLSKQLTLDINAFPTLPEKTKVLGSYIGRVVDDESFTDADKIVMITNSIEEHQIPMTKAMALHYTGGKFTDNNFGLLLGQVLPNKDASNLVMKLSENGAIVNPAFSIQLVATMVQKNWIDANLARHSYTRDLSLQLLGETSTIISSLILSPDIEKIGPKLFYYLKNGDHEYTNNQEHIELALKYLNSITRNEDQTTSNIEESIKDELKRLKRSVFKTLAEVRITNRNNFKSMVGNLRENMLTYIESTAAAVSSTIQVNIDTKENLEEYESGVDIRYKEKTTSKWPFYNMFFKEKGADFNVKKIKQRNLLAVKMQQNLDDLVKFVSKEIEAQAGFSEKQVVVSPKANADAFAKKKKPSKTNIVPREVREEKIRRQQELDDEQNHLVALKKDNFNEYKAKVLAQLKSLDYSSQDEAISKKAIDNLIAIAKGLGLNSILTDDDSGFEYIPEASLENRKSIGIKLNERIGFYLDNSKNNVVNINKILYDSELKSTEDKQELSSSEVTSKALVLPSSVPSALETKAELKRVDVTLTPGLAQSKLKALSGKESETNLVQLWKALQSKMATDFLPVFGVDGTYDADLGTYVETYTCTGCGDDNKFLEDFTNAIGELRKEDSDLKKAIACSLNMNEFQGKATVTVNGNTLTPLELCYHSIEQSLTDTTEREKWDKPLTNMSPEAEEVRKAYYDYEMVRHLDSNRQVIYDYKAAVSLFPTIILPETTEPSIIETVDNEFIQFNKTVTIIFETFNETMILIDGKTRVFSVEQWKEIKLKKEKANAEKLIRDKQAEMGIKEARVFAGLALEAREAGIERALGYRLFWDAFYNIGKFEKQHKDDDTLTFGIAKSSQMYKNMFYALDDYNASLTFFGSIACILLMIHTVMRNSAWTRPVTTLASLLAVLLSIGIYVPTYGKDILSSVFIAGPLILGAIQDNPATAGVGTGVFVVLYLFRGKIYKIFLSDPSVSTKSLQPAGPQVAGPPLDTESESDPFGYPGIPSYEGGSKIIPSEITDNKNIMFTKYNNLQPSSAPSTPGGGKPKKSSIRLRRAIGKTKKARRTIHKNKKQKKNASNKKNKRGKTKRRKNTLRNK
jgi:hypothetical protein